MVAAKPRRVRGFLFEVLIAIGVFTWGPLSLLTAPFSYRVRYWFVLRWCVYVMWLLRVLCGVRIEAEGVENVPATAGVVMCKHQSTWETLALPFWFHPLTWVLKREVIRLPVFGWALGLLEPIAIDRGSRHRAFQQVVEQGWERLSQGRWVAVFPEGTRVPAGYRGRYLPGAAFLATRSGRPVVPVAHNAGEHWPRRRVAKIPGIIRVRIGPAIPSEGKKPAALMAEVEAWIEAQMPEISDFGYPGTLHRG